MTEAEFRDLEPGDAVRHAGSDGKYFVVTAHYGHRVTAVATVDLTNPSEWVIVKTGGEWRSSEELKAG